MIDSDEKPRLLVALAVCFLVLFVVQLVMSARANTITWDEECHIYAGYMMWKHGDFGLNPEHPPLVKLVAALPLLGMNLQEPAMPDRPYRLQEMLGGEDFIFHNDADKVVFRTRIAAMLFTLLLVALVFGTAREMFGTGAGLIALGLIAFDPTLLAHGALVTTDVGQACFMLASIYAFYRYVKSPTAGRMLLTGLAVGLALASKHSTVLLAPMLITLAVIETLWSADKTNSTAQRAWRYAWALVVICVISVAVLWASYGFRYAAREDGLALNPPMAEQLAKVPGAAKRELLTVVAKAHVLPESYVYGMAHVFFSANAFHSFVLGKAYPRAVWFYFPVAMAIKSSLTFLILLGITIWAVATRRMREWRELLFLTVPCAIYLVISMLSGENIGIRHVLPIYVFLSIAIAGAMWRLIQGNRRWLYVVVALLVFQAISVGRTYPSYIAYANEAAGGPANLNKYLSDSSVDWAQQLHAVKGYLDKRGVKNCWFAYFGYGLIDYKYYGIPCKPLPTIESVWLGGPSDVPASIDGPVLISATDLSGFEFGPDVLSPYAQFKSLKPTAVIDYSVFVYDGHFNVPLASAISHTQKANELLADKQPAQAMTEAQQAVSLAPDSVAANAALGDALSAMGRSDDAKTYYGKALTLASTVEPRFQSSWIPMLERKLNTR
jgi:hypothetical protein